MASFPPPFAPTRKEALRAVAILVASASLFGLMAFVAKLATTRIGGAQAAMIRFLVGLAPILLSTRLRRSAFAFHRLDIVVWRGIFGGLAVLLYFSAIRHIPVGLATLLNYTSPIFAGAFAAMFLGESIRGRVMFPLALTLTGIFMVVRTHAAPEELIGFGRWEAAALGSAVLSGAALTAIRLARRSEGSWTIFGSLCVFGIVATAPVAVASWVWPTPYEWLLLVMVGLISIAAQILMTHAYRWLEALVAGVISQFGVIVSMALGAAFLGEALTLGSAAGTMLTITGVALVIAGTAPRTPPPVE